MSEDSAASETKTLQLDFGEPEPNVCTNCEKEFDRQNHECPHCGHNGYGHDPHPQDEVTSQLIRQLVTAGAGYVAIRLRLPADHQAFMWWNCGFEGRARGPGGTWEKFTHGVDEVFDDASVVELLHREDCPPTIARQMRGNRGLP